MTVQDDGGDPFAHLHDEAYADAYVGRRSTFLDAVHMGGRRTIPLDGQWHFTPDLFDEGLRQGWHRDSADPPSQWATPRDAELWTADTVAVPGCWTMARPEWRFFEGAAWYARIFDWSPADGPRLVLRLGAGNYEMRVFLNGTLVGSHRGGSTPAFFELTATIRPGENRLLVQVDNRRRPDRVPMHHFDWFNHGGLHREVGLLPLPTVFIRSFRVWLATDGVHVTLVLSDPVSGVATVTLDGQDTIVTLTDGMGQAVLPATPDRWSPENPVLHDMTAAFETDHVTDRVGLRLIETAGTAILLNGSPVYLRGVCVHEDDAELGRVATEDDMRRRARHAKELGCNMLRLAHYPHHERMAEIADEVGLLLWAEIPVYWAIDFHCAATYEDAENQLLELIARDANRASVVLWGVGNENADTDARYVFMSRLARAARAADRTRLIAAACLINREHFRIEDRLTDHLDVIGINEYFGWYEPGFDGLARLLANSRPDKPVVISETGADALAGHHGGVRQLFTEECQAEYFRQQIALVSHVEYVRGFCPWLLYDFRTERRQTGFQRGFSRKGLIADDKSTKKLAFEVVRASYALLDHPPSAPEFDPL